MNRILNYTISDADAGMIVLDFLRKQGFSRHILTAMKADKEALSVNDQKVGGRTILCAGDHFRVRLLETVSPDGIIPASMDIPVLKEEWKRLKELEGRFGKFRYSAMLGMRGSSMAGDPLSILLDYVNMLLHLDIIALIPCSVR